MTRPTDPHRWARIADLFERALSVRAEDRAAWLVAVCGDDEQLYDEISSLLRVHERAGSWLSGPPSDADPAPDVLPPLPTQPIGPYRVRRVIGTGGMGVVYEAEDTRRGRTVALKAVAGADDARQHVARLQREARAAAAIVHPNIATVYSLEEADGQIYMASELVDGKTLRDELARGPLPFVRAIEAALAVARAAAAAHARGIVHRDLKPENVACAPDGTFKVLDFGLAVAAASAAISLTDDGTLIGTPGYMSPEQIRGNRVDGRADQFAIGVLLYELVTGTHPFRARTPATTLARVLEAAPDPLRVHLPDDARLLPDDVLDRLEATVARCLQKRPEHRFADTAALVAALERLLSVVAPAADPPRPSTRAVWWWQFHQAAVTIGYLLLLLPVWQVRAGLDVGLALALPLAALVAALVAGWLRLHLWFALREYPEQWASQHSRARRSILAADLVFAAVLLVAGVLATANGLGQGPLLVGAGAVVSVLSLVVEPATTRAAAGR